MTAKRQSDYGPVDASDVGPVGGGAVLLLALVLAAALVGVLAFSREQIFDIDQRLPYYYILIAALFAVSIAGTIRQTIGPGLALVKSVGTTILTGLLVVFAIEGVVYAARNPEVVLTIEFVAPLLAGSLIAIGIGLWALRYWDDLVGALRL